MKLSLGLVWRWSWIVTVPVSLFFISWVWSTSQRYYTFGVRYDATPMNINIRGVGELEFANVLRKYRINANIVSKKHWDSSKKIDTVHLFAGQGQLAKLDSELPYSGFEYVEAGILQTGDIQKVSLRYRGDLAHHWGFHKKSYRVKTKKKSLFKGMRKFNLIAPKGAFQLHNYLGYKLAALLGLMVPKSELVNLTMNGKDKGLHLMVEQLEEIVLRNNKRMPGDIYVGELIAGDAYKGVSRNVFEHPGLWSKQATNNHYDLDSNTPLRHLITLLQSPMTEEAQQELTNMIDVVQWGRFSAFEALAQTFHIDQTHNWRLYYDPMRSVFEPVVWDPIAWSGGQGDRLHPDMIRTVFHKALFSNGQFLRARQKAFQEFFDDSKDLALLKEMEKSIEIVGAGLVFDADIRYPQHVMQKALAVVPLRIKKSLAYIKEQFVDQGSEVHFSPKTDGIALQVMGRKPISGVVLEFLTEVPLIRGVTLKYWVDGVEFSRDVSGGVLVSGSQVTVDVSLIGGSEILLAESDTKNQLLLSAGYYELVFELEGHDFANLNLLEVLEKGDKDRNVSIAKIQDLPQLSFKNLYDVVREKPKKAPLVWRDEVVIEGDRFIERDLVIMPGTVVRMMPGALLEIRGRLLAKGTKDNPVNFEPFGKNQEPWGAVVLKGKRTNDSRVEFSVFDGGSGVKRDLFEYTAMFSVHGSEGVVVENSHFSNSKITDDMVHVVYSDIQFRDTVFENSLLDGLDIDVSHAVLSNVQFLSSGNDALDLMASDVVVVGADIRGSGDKGVSVGEGSTLLLVDSILARNEIGVQVKDGSLSSLVNVELLYNKKALDGYRKNWRYSSGGKLFLHKSVLRGNGLQSSVDKFSKIFVSDSFFDEKIFSNNVVFKKNVDRGETVQSMSSAMDFEAVEIPLINSLPRKYKNHIDPNIRGRLDQ